MRCINCGRQSIFLKVNDAMHCKSCAEKFARLEEIKRKEEEARRKQEEKERNEIRNQKRIEAKVYYEQLCAAYMLVAADLDLPRTKGLSSEQLSTKYEACKKLLQLLQQWKNYELFPEVYLRDSKPYSQLSGYLENPRLPAGCFRSDSLPDFNHHFSKTIEKLHRNLTLFLLADSPTHQVGVGHPHSIEQFDADCSQATKTYHVTGIRHYEDNLMNLAHINIDYEMTKKELIDSYMVDEMVWKYVFYPDIVQLVPEPDNPHDPNAIKVVIDAEHIGYIKAGSCAHLLKIIKENRILSISCKIGGGPYKILSGEYDDKKEKDVYSLERGEYSYSVTLHISEDNVT